MRRKSVVWNVVSVSPIFLLTGCISLQPPPKPAVDIGAGWNCLSYPSAFRDAGVVFEVENSNGSATTFQDFSQTPGVIIKPGQFVDVKASRSNTVNAGIVASILGLPLKANANGGSNYTITQTFSNATQTDVDEPSTNLLKSAFYTSSAANTAIANGDARLNKYYLVRNTIKSDNVSYSFDRDISADIDVGVTPVKIGSIEATGKFDNKNGITYTKTFKEPVDVCIQPVLLPLPKLSGPAAAAFVAAPNLGDVPLFRTYK